MIRLLPLVLLVACGKQIGTYQVEAPAPAAASADAKTSLQEWAQGRGLEPPVYEEVERRGPDHAPEFTIAVRLGSFPPLTATGPSKKLAEHKAAEAFLVREKVWEGAAR